MNNTLLISHYVMWAALLGTAAITLRACRGVSLLSIYSISFALQVGTLYAVAGEWGMVRLSNEAMQRFGLSLIIAYGILMMFLWGLFFLSERKKNPPPVRFLTIPRDWMLIGLILLAGVVVVRMSSASTRMVLQQGLEALGDSGYYDLRTELIQVENESLSRVVNYFESTSRQVLFILLIIAALDLARKWSWKMAAFYFALVAGMSLNGLVRLQKSPVLWVLAAASIPFAISTASSGRRGVAKIIVRLVAGSALVVLVGSVLYSVTEGHTMLEGLGRVMGRMFTVPSSVSCMHFEVYPNLLPYVQWSDITPVRMLAGNDALMPENRFISIDVAQALTGVKFNANASFLAESWAAAGYFGVVVGTLIMASFCVGTDYFVMRAGRTISLLPLGIYYWLGITSFGNVSFITCVVQYGLWFVPGFYCLVFARWQLQRPARLRRPEQFRRLARLRQRPRVGQGVSPLKTDGLSSEYYGNRN